MVDVRKVRGGSGLDPLGDEVDALLDAVTESTSRATGDFFATYDRDPHPRLLASWLEPAPAQLRRRISLADGSVTETPAAYSAGS